MNGPIDGVPIIGQPQRVVIADHRIIAPNSVELIDNGLNMGTSVACLRVMDPLKGRAYHVPLTEAQLDELGSQINAVLTAHNPTDYPRS